jgi:DNA end-binding protein Ku
MAPRASWKGYLKLSLVSCPIALYPAASSSERVSFNRINKKTGTRLKQQLVDAETGETVEKEDIARGYEIGKGQYLQIEDEEIEKIRIESSHTISIDTFVPRTEIDDRYLDSPYYIAPTDKVGQEAFAVIRDAIRDKKMVALGRVALSRRVHAMMLEAFDKGLLAIVLRYSYEVRDQAVSFEDILDLKLPADMKELAAHIVDSKTSHFDPLTFVDHYETALVDMLRAKQAGRVIEAAKEEPAPHRVINLMDALRASIGADSKKKPAAAGTKARAGVPFSSWRSRLQTNRVEMGRAVDVDRIRRRVVWKGSGHRGLVVSRLVFPRRPTRPTRGSTPARLTLEICNTSS